MMTMSSCANIPKGEQILQCDIPNIFIQDSALFPLNCSMNYREKSIPKEKIVSESKNGQDKGIIYSHSSILDCKSRYDFMSKS